MPDRTAPSSVRTRQSADGERSGSRRSTDSGRSGSVDDAVSALRSLGYSKAEAASAVASATGVLGSRADVSTIIKTALRRAAT